jgi:hypothetical protein
MRRSSSVTLSRLIAGLLAGLLLAILAVPLVAQPATQTHPYYDVKLEVTLSGTVSSVISKTTPGMVAGSHLMLTTESGAVDASLGRWGMQGKGALSVAAGQSVEVTGVMKTLRDKQVFVARTVKVGGQTYVMRNEHGIAVSPQSRARGGQTSKGTFGVKGESR